MAGAAVTAALPLDRVAVTGIAPGPAVLWARRHWSTAGLDAYRTLRGRLELHPRQPRVVLVSSAAAGDGKSLTAVNLAGALALGGGPVLLLDADLRRPAVHLLVGIDAGPGLAGVLRGTHTLQQACRRVEEHAGLFVLPAGQVGPDAGDLLATPAWHDVRGVVRASFRYVVIDGPPVGANAEYEWLESACDGVLLVVRPGHTARAAARRAVDRLGPHRLLGLVWNGAPSTASLC